MAQGLQHMLGNAACQLQTVAAEQILDSLNDDVAVLFLTHVNFRSGFIHDMKQITRAAHDKGILVIWDLAHSAGVLPVELNACDVDFAIGCGYKYLNGGPGAPAFVFAAKRFHGQLQQPLTGWMGHAQPFAFTPEYQGAPNIKQFLAGTPAVISMSILDAAMDLFTSITIDAIRTKSLMLTDFFAAHMETVPELQDLLPISPTAHHLRGSQLSYRHPDAYAICQALIAEGIVADFRAPDILRIGFSPLFLRFSDLELSLNTLAGIMSSKRYLEPQYQTRNTVT
jgi:kynureninase